MELIERPGPASRHGQLFPVLNYETPDPECPISVVRSLEQAPGDSFVNVNITPPRPGKRHRRPAIRLAESTNSGSDDLVIWDLTTSERPVSEVDSGRLLRCVTSQYSDQSSARREVTVRLAAFVCFLLDRPRRARVHRDGHVRLLPQRLRVVGDRLIDIPLL